MFSFPDESWFDELKKVEMWFSFASRWQLSDREDCLPKMEVKMSKVEMLQPDFLIIFFSVGNWGMFQAFSFFAQDSQACCIFSSLCFD